MTQHILETEARASVLHYAVEPRHVAEYHRNLALEVYRQIFERFGAVPEIVLVELAHAPLEQLASCGRSLYATRSLEDFVGRFGWKLPQGGEGNYSLDDERRTEELTFDAREQLQERLSCLRRAQAVHSLGVPATLRPEPLSESPHFAKAKRTTDGKSAALPTPVELLALKYEQDPLSRAFLRRAACARTEGQSHGYHAGTLGALMAVLSTQLQQRFGELPDWATQRIETATLDQLYTWIKRVIVADSLQSALHCENLQLEETAL